MAAQVPTITLNTGQKIPQLGFGVFQIKPADTATAVEQAIKIGYRHIDTAEMYGNESEVADGIAASGVDPAQIWVTSKINNKFHGYDRTMSAFDGTLKALRTERIDLILIHWPLPTVGDFVGTWKALQEVHADGRAGSIGVSNFQPAHLDTLARETDVVPAVNQIEVHPYLTQQPLREFDTAHGIATEAWSPIAQGGVLKDPVLTGLAEKYGQSPAQIVLRWHVQLDNIIFPKSSSPERMRENFDIFSFELAPDDMADISALNKDERTGPDPDEFDYIPD